MLLSLFVLLCICVLGLVVLVLALALALVLVLGVVRIMFSALLSRARFHVLVVCCGWS